MSQNTLLSWRREESKKEKQWTRVRRDLEVRNMRWLNSNMGLLQPFG
jgi:hypothetical protein